PGERARHSARPRPDSGARETDPDRRPGGTRHALCWRMSTRPPRTYDEIVARTVPEPDSSFRPTQEQQREGLARVEPPRDVALAAKVDEALREEGAEHVAFEI